MKTARERAQDVFNSLPGTAQLAIKYDGLGVKAWLSKVESLMFKEHARDQRHACAEAVTYAGVAAPDAATAVSRSHAAVMNAPAPGETR